MAVPIFLVITGYVYSMSFERNNYTLCKLYRPKEIVCRWLRFIIPFFPAWTIIIIARIVVKEERFSVLSILIDFLSGGYGSGAYYFPVMLQIVLMIPIIDYFIKKKTMLGLLVCFLVNLIFELLKSMFCMDPDIYRICSLRFIFILGYGCFLYHSKKNSILKWVIGIGFIGAVYLYIFNYTKLTPIITNQWTNNSLFAVLFIMPVMMFAIEKKNVSNIVLENLGKASFNILLVQMVFYVVGDEIVNRLIPLIPLRLLVNVILCCGFGFLYYRIENRITRRIIWLIKGGESKR